MARRHKEPARGPTDRPSRLRVVLADDQTILRHGLRAILDAEPDLEVIGEASNMQDAIELSRRLLPDVVITDIAFSNGIEVQAISRLRRECAGARVLLLTGHSCQECMRAAMTAGVHGYILKHSPFEVLLRAIRSEGSEYEHSELSLRALGEQERSTTQFAKAQIAEMTARERQVLIGVALGYSNKRIAGNLGRPAMRWTTVCCTPITAQRSRARNMRPPKPAHCRRNRPVRDDERSPRTSNFKALP
jgi:two-component system response regulator NreC